MIRLDHVALATRDAGAALDVLVSQWGGTILFGGQAIGYRPMQVRVGDGDQGMNVELLEPWNTEQNDFLERFLTRSGEGPHHLTFKVGSLTDMLERVAAAGLTTIGVNRSDPTWQEAFIHPRDAHGTVVQLAQSTYDNVSFRDLFAEVRTNGPDGHPGWWPTLTPSDVPAGAVALRRVVLATPDIAATRDFFTSLLEGDVVEEGEGWVELAWPGGGHLRLEAAPAPAGITRLEAAGLTDDTVVVGTRVVPANQ